MQVRAPRTLAGASDSNGRRSLTLVSPLLCAVAATVHCRLLEKQATISGQLSGHVAHKRCDWVVVNGTAEVTRGNEQFILHENEATHISPCTIHRLSNPGKVPLNLIEVQSGSYLGEDDIVRYEDTYGRN